MSQHAVAESSSGSFPAFEGEPHYVEGYTPSSLDSQHSSLQRTSTWLGMGFLLASVAGIGTMVFGLASKTVETQEHWLGFTIAGIIMIIVMWIAGFGLIHYGRRHYRAYRERTGRIH